MSNKPITANIPPPDDYTPKSKPLQAGKFRERGKGGGNYIRSNKTTIKFIKDQPRDKFHRNEDDDYFALLDDDEVAEEEKCSQEGNTIDDNIDDEDDPLDVYMKSLENDKGETSHELKDSKKIYHKVDDNYKKKLDEKLNITSEIEKKAIRLDIDETEDIQESYYQYVEQTRGKRLASGEPLEQLSEIDSDERQNLVEYDTDGNILSVKKLKKEIEPLPSIDHSTIRYDEFQKIFYNEHDEIEKLTPEQGEELRIKLDIKVSGINPPKPVCSFAHFKFDEQLMKVIRKSQYTQPTPIQAQAIPAALLGRNIIGIAMTGSGKTAAYLWPMIVHIMGQPDLKRGDGPIALILVPTRELALQVYGEAKKFSNSYKIATVCAYGGGSKYEQSRDLEAGAEIVVATPGRIIDLIKLNSTNLRRVTYLVLDEADRFFEMGFEAQVKSICNQIRPDRQTLLFSATFKKKIEQLASSVVDNPVKIVQKALGEANEDVTQHVIVLEKNEKKWNWLISKLVEFTSAGSVLIFVTRIVNAEELNKNLINIGKETLLLHGDMEQSERNRVITTFKRKEKDIMIATDVAARGLDIAHIKTVINYDLARDIDTHIHRIGRTGRAGSKGDAYTLVTMDKDKEFAGHLVKNLEQSNQNVPDELLKLAMQSYTFRKSRINSKHKQNTNNNNYNKDIEGNKRYHHHGYHHKNEFSSSSSSYERNESSNRHRNYSNQHQRGYIDRSPNNDRDKKQIHYHRSSSNSHHEYSNSDRSHRTDKSHTKRSSTDSYYDHKKRFR